MCILRWWRFSGCGALPGGEVMAAFNRNMPPIHPGRILLDDLQDEQINIDSLAQAIRVPANRISLIVNEKRGITAETAARLGRYFGTSAQYWLKIQNRFDLDYLDWAAIERDVIPK